MAKEHYENFLKVCQGSNQRVIPLFPVLFSQDLNLGEARHRLDFFEAIATYFPRDPQVLEKVPTEEFMKREFKLDYEKEILHIYYFVTYLTEKVYPKLQEKYGNFTNNNIFGFALGFPIKQTKVVILAENLGSDSNISSSGYAFHKTADVSTTALLGHLEMEILLAHKFAQYFSIYNPKRIYRFNKDLPLQQRKMDANLQGWINQRILLINTMLTDKDDVWRHFTKFLIGYLNEHGNRIVFILMGEVSKSIRSEITNSAHEVINVEHPANDRQKNPENASSDGTDVNTFQKNLPFLKAAYLKFLKTGEIIDWLAIADYIDTEEVTDNRRRKLFQQLFQKMRDTSYADIEDKELSNALEIIKEDKLSEYDLQKIAAFKDFFNKFKQIADDKERGGDVVEKIRKIVKNLPILFDDILNKNNEESLGFLAAIAKYFPAADAITETKKAEAIFLFTYWEYGRK